MKGLYLRPILAIAFSIGVMIVVMIPSSKAGVEELFAQQAEKEIVSVTAEFTASKANQPGQLSITAQIEPSWHIYSITQLPGGPLPTEIKLRSTDAFHQVGDIRAEPLPDRRREPAFDNLVVETHHDRVTWHIPIAIASGVDLDSLTVEGLLRFQSCNLENCLPPKSLPFTARLARNAVLPTEGSMSMALREPEGLQATAPKAPLASPGPIRPDTLEIATHNELEQTSMAVILGLGFLGGLILNLMPCVLPVIGLKILSFLQQAGQSQRRALALNVWYSLGLLTVFIVLATLAVFCNMGWGQLFSMTRFNVILAAVVFVMSLSLLGVWDIPIPGLFGSGKANHLSEREGAIGAFCKGVLTTILATPCSGPFLASALAWAVGRPPIESYAVFIAVGIGMASPYLLIGAFPKLIRFLPKPGPWMDTFKQVMGFVLLGTVAYLLTLIPWASIVPTVTFLFGLWAACWWIGRTPLTSEFHHKARAWLSAAALTGVVWLISFAWLAEVTAARFEHTLQTACGNMVNHKASRSKDELTWRPFSRKIFDELTATQTTVMVDFTADWCMTCKTLEKFVLNTPRICNAVRQHGVATLRADWTHASPEVTQMLEILGSKQVPVIAIFPAGRANRPIILRGSYTHEMLLGALDKASRYVSRQTRPQPTRLSTRGPSPNSVSNERTAPSGLL
ncbi:MAG: thioredoxin family protein [Pirellulales bacterium]|nr:thioredoxin family protein [Pirellulales bacterium]